jgi:hypothetical protein
MHYSNIKALHEAAAESGVDYTVAGLGKECTENNIIGCICMGLTETAPGLTPDKNAQTPMLADLTNSINLSGKSIENTNRADTTTLTNNATHIDPEDTLPPPISICMGINPHNIDTQALMRVEQALAETKNTKITNTSPGQKNIAGFKIYAGYYHVDINDNIYKPIYKLASDNNLAVAIHGGETYFRGGLVEYSRPIHVDKLAHVYPGMKIIICHLGFPWVMEACEIATKNQNVFVDISGLAVGGATECELVQNEPLMRDYFRQGLIFMNDYKKVLFGTDWPLVPIAPYIELCKSLIPEHAWEDVFHNNATRVYGV